MTVESEQNHRPCGHMVLLSSSSTRAHTRPGAGLASIHDRIQDLGGTVRVRSSPGRGTALLILLRWPLRADRDQ